MHQVSCVALNGSKRNPSPSCKTSSAMSCRFSRGQLVEVNAHSLFSKWFSESGKLVSRLFARIQVRFGTIGAAVPRHCSEPTCIVLANTLTGGRGLAASPFCQGLLDRTGQRTHRWQAGSHSISPG